MRARAHTSRGTVRTRKKLNWPLRPSMNFESCNIATQFGRKLPTAWRHTDRHCPDITNRLSSRHTLSPQHPHKISLIFP